MELIRRAKRRGVLIERGDIFFHGERPPLNHFRIGFTAIPPRAITEGIAILGQECHELLAGQLSDS